MAGVPGIEPGMTGSKPVALPLGYTPTIKRLCYSAQYWEKWCRNQDSNPGPDDYKSTALPTELLRHIKLKCTYI
jgi:hypothetical protein